tara:strand:- start:1063 stop:3144 length:2082 start_codon:yes stop_codon:yes gene_type:complete
MKKLLSIIVLGLFLNIQVYADNHEKYYIEKKEEPKYELYNSYVKNFNKWIDDTENNKSCNISNLPKTITPLRDISDCTYKQAIKYMKRNNIDLNPIILDAQYDFYLDIQDRGKTLELKWGFNNKDMYEEWKQWAEYYVSELDALTFYQKDIWTKFALKKNIEYLATKEKEDDADNSKKQEKNDKDQTYSELELNELISKANKEDIDAQYELYIYYYGLGKFEESFKWLKKVATLGYSSAQNDLGFMLDNGLGTKENKVLAYKWFLKAAEQDQINAITTLASYYLDGEVVDQSYVKAFEFYNKAANLSFENLENKSILKNQQSRAIYGLGLMHEKGQGTKFDYKKAKSFYLKADEYGHEIARLRYDALEGDGAIAEYLAAMYYVGSNIDIGIPIDLSEAAFWFKISEYKGVISIGKKFEEVLDKISARDLRKANNRFEIWKKNSGFEYDKETLKEVTPYSLNHTGTAFYINENTLLTNKHVVHQDNEKCDKITGFSPYDGKYETYEHYDTSYLPKSGDIEILKSKKATTSYIKISNEELEIGEDVFLIGFPQGDKISKYPKISKGMVNSEIGVYNDTDQFILDAISYPGSSGSPVLNNKGNLIGILWGGDSQELLDNEGEIANKIADPNISYAIKNTYINKFLKINNILPKKSSNTLLGKFFDSIILGEGSKNIAKNNIPSLRFIECYKKNDQE